MNEIAEFVKSLETWSRVVDNHLKKSYSNSTSYLSRCSWGLLYWIQDLWRSSQFSTLISPTYPSSSLFFLIFFILLLYAKVRLPSKNPNAKSRFAECVSHCWVHYLTDEPFWMIASNIIIRAHNPPKLAARKVIWKRSFVHLIFFLRA